jgi:transposase
VAYLQRRTAQGKSKREVIRCLKRYIAREVFAVLTTMAAQAVATTA